MEPATLCAAFIAVSPMTGAEFGSAEPKLTKPDALSKTLKHEVDERRPPDTKLVRSRSTKSKARKQNAPRRNWTIDLHAQFARAWKKIDAAGVTPTPKKILAEMQIDGVEVADLTMRQVQSHHQKYKMQRSQELLCRETIGYGSSNWHFPSWPSHGQPFPMGFAQYEPMQPTMMKSDICPLPVSTADLCALFDLPAALASEPIVQADAWLPSDPGNGVLMSSNKLTGSDDSLDPSFGMPDYLDSGSSSSDDSSPWPSAQHSPVQSPWLPTAKWYVADIMNRSRPVGAVGTALEVAYATHSLDERAVLAVPPDFGLGAAKSPPMPVTPQMAAYERALHHMVDSLEDAFIVDLISAHTYKKTTRCFSRLGN